MSTVLCSEEKQDGTFIASRRFAPCWNGLLLSLTPAPALLLVETSIQTHAPDKARQKHCQHRNQEQQRPCAIKDKCASQRYSTNQHQKVRLLFPRDRHMSRLPLLDSSLTVLPRIYK